MKPAFSRRLGCGAGHRSPSYPVPWLCILRIILPLSSLASDFEIIYLHLARSALLLSWTFLLNLLHPLLLFSVRSVLFGLWSPMHAPSSVVFFFRVSFISLLSYRTFACCHIFSSPLLGGDIVSLVVHRHVLL